ncbi:MAG: hypothetical protein BWY44_01263 [Candidatus Omnitrophica bacterium ADurb.Bin292]|nr:MAG: hypothetical protein BWY44_01263 [Candidatus Omnitrophica bacterium ADurb.Bin292]
MNVARTLFVGIQNNLVDNMGHRRGLGQLLDIFNFWHFRYGHGMILRGGFGKNFFHRICGKAIMPPEHLLDFPLRSKTDFYFISHRESHFIQRVDIKNPGSRDEKLAFFRTDRKKVIIGRKLHRNMIKHHRIRSQSFKADHRTSGRF